MRTFKTIFAFVVFTILVSCGAKKSPNESYDKSPKMMETPAAEADSISVVSSSSAAVETGKDSDRKFIRTADLKFKAKSVVQATYNIEDIVVRHGGFVSYTNLTSNINSINSTSISADSTLETTYYAVTNQMILRVPNTKLDTTLKDISKNIDYLDYRIIQANDVALNILSNNLTQQRAAKNEQRLTNAIDNRGRKLGETIEGEELLLDKQERADNARIANLSLKDQINFSTITLEIYQRQALKREMIANEKNIDEYKPSFGSQIIDSLAFGWEVLSAVLLFFVKIWWVILAIVIGFIAYKKFKKE